jgi:hypothetical protein
MAETLGPQVLHIKLCCFKLAKVIIRDQFFLERLGGF